MGRKPVGAGLEEERDFLKEDPVYGTSKSTGQSEAARARLGLPISVGVSQTAVGREGGSPGGSLWLRSWWFEIITRLKLILGKNGNVDKETGPSAAAGIHGCPV